VAPPEPRPRAGLDPIARAYRLGTVTACRYLPDGLLNRNWRLDTDAGPFALKELDALDPDSARRSLALMASVAADGVPVAAAVPAADGTTVAEIGGHGYYLTPWIDGTHLLGPDMDADTSFHMGAVIGRIHTALARPGLLPETGPSTEGPPTVATAHDRIGDYLDQIAARAEPDAFDRAAEPLLRSRLDLIAAHEHLRPSEDPPAGPAGWTHGDCQNWNLLWRGDRIAAVLDWDRVRPNPYGEEIVRAAAYQFALPDGRIDLDNVAALVAGYRTVADIGPDALADAARRRWWRLLTSVWHLKYHYYLDRTASDHVFFSDERLLRWWTANLDAVEAAFTRERR
jgi:homoserine kinase type II